MGNLTKSKAGNVWSPNGNSLATFVNTSDNQLYFKDAVGNIQPLSDFVSNPAGNTPNLTQVLVEGDISTWLEQIPTDEFITLAVDRRLTENYYDTSMVGTGGLFLDKTVLFPVNSTIKFQAGFVEESATPSYVTLLPYQFTTDAFVFYNGTPITEITIKPKDICVLKYAGVEASTGAQIWFLSFGGAETYEMSTAKIIHRCPSNAFRNAHGNLKIGDVQYYGTRTSPPELIRFPNPNDLSIFTKITLASSSFGSIEYLAYNEALGKIYACLNTNKLLVINDIVDITDYDIIDITLSAGNLAASSVVMTDDAHIYIGTATGLEVARFIKLDATDYSEVYNVPWIGDDSSNRLNIHSAVWSSDKSELFFCQNGGVNYMAFVNPSDMTYTELFVGNSITDDICIMEDTGSMLTFNRFIFCPTEGRQLGTKGGFLVDIDMRVSYAFDALPSTGCYWDADTKILTSACINGAIQTWTGENAVAMALGYLDPKKASDVYIDLNGNWFNEITKIDGKFFATIWNNDPSFGEDGLGALVELDLIKVVNGAISVTESLFITDRYLKSQYVGSVTSVSYIDITFSNADWATLILKDYGINITPNNSDSADAIDKWYPSNKNGQSFRLNFRTPVTADLDLTIVIDP